MTVPYRTFLALGAAVGLLGAGYVLAPQPKAAALATAPKVAATTTEAAPVAPVSAPAAPTVNPVATLATNRAPTPLAPRKHSSYFTQTAPDGSLQTASATAGPLQPGATSSDGSTASAIAGGNTDGGLPPLSDDAKAGMAQAKAAIELDGYKNVRIVDKAPDGTYRGRAMRGRTEIAVRVDASGSVSAE